MEYIGPNILSGLTLIACNKDTDGDGLTDREEADFGSDPEKVDSDDDGLTDAEEFVTLPIQTVQMAMVMAI